jgi:hypothetical protein
MSAAIPLLSLPTTAALLFLLRNGGTALPDDGLMSRARE